MDLETDLVKYNSCYDSMIYRLNLKSKFYNKFSLSF